jgi:hypothetical protein
MSLQTLRVARVEAAGLRFAQYAGEPVLAQHGRIAGLLQRHLSPLLASLYARGVATADGRYLEWYTDLAGQPVPLAQLSGPARAAAEQVLGERLAAVRALGVRLAGQGDGASAELLRLVCGAPGPERVYVINGQPVVTGWGLEGEAPAALVEPEPVPVAVPSGSRWGAWLVGLGLVGTLAGLALWWWRPWEVRPVGPTPAQAELARLQDEAGALGRELVALEEALAARRAACPKPEVKPPPVPEPTPEPPEPEPPKVVVPKPPKPPKPPKKVAPAKPPDLPADRWRKGDLSMLEGCWVLGRDALDSLGSGGKAIRGIERAGRMCFGRDGTGTRESRSEFPGEPPITCSAPITAWFEGDTLRTRQPQVKCSTPGYTWNGPPNALSCKRIDDNTALCHDGRGYEREFRREKGG